MREYNKDGGALPKIVTPAEAAAPPAKAILK